MAKPTLFIGCSEEALPLAKAIDQGLKSKVSTTIWEEAKIQGSILSKTLEAINTTDFGLFIFNKDLQIIKDENIETTTTTNVILETGMFLGNKESEDQLILLKPKDTKKFQIPSDLSNVITIDYDIDLIENSSNKDTLNSLIKNIADKIEATKIPKKKELIDDSIQNNQEIYSYLTEPCLNNTETLILKVIYENILSKKYPLICYTQLIDLNERYEITENLKITISKLERENIIEVIKNNCSGSQKCHYIAINDEWTDFIDNLFL